MPKRAGLVACLAIFLLTGCIGGQASESKVLSPHQVDSSMVGQVIEVRGKITALVENPGGLGGVYLNLGDNEAEVGVRIQPDIWESFDKNKKAEFQEGRTITAEGVLFQAGRELVIILGKYSLSSSNATSTK